MTRWATAAFVALVVLAVAALLVTWFGHYAGRAELALRIGVLLGLATLGAFLPVSGALEELRYPTDNLALEIDTNYAKDDRYFALTLEGAMALAAGEEPRACGTYEIPGLGPFATVPGPVEIRKPPTTILDVQGPCVVDANVDVPEPIVASSDVSVGQRATVAAVKTHAAINLATGVQVRRWLDSESSIDVEPHCDLGARTTALKNIWLGPDVRFRVLAAPVIVAGNGIRRPPTPPPQEKQPISIFVNHDSRLRNDRALLVQTSFTLPEALSVAGDLIARGDVRLGAGSTLGGSIHADGSVRLAANAIVTRSVYAEGDVHLETGAAILEHLVTRGSARLDAGASVGTEGRITTVLADNDVSLGPAATVYGRVVAGRSGVTTES